MKEDIVAYDAFLERLVYQQKRGRAHWQIASDPDFDLMYTHRMLQKFQNLSK